MYVIVLVLVKTNFVLFNRFHYLALCPRTLPTHSTGCELFWHQIEVCHSKAVRCCLE